MSSVIYAAFEKFSAFAFKIFVFVTSFNKFLNFKKNTK